MAPATGKRVAVLGAGPAGVAAAVQLAAAGHAVTLFDRAAAPGGMAQETIPAERLPDSDHRGARSRTCSPSAATASSRRYGRDRRRTARSTRSWPRASTPSWSRSGLSDSAPLPGPTGRQRACYGALEFLARAKRRQAPYLAAQRCWCSAAATPPSTPPFRAKRCGAADVAIVYRRSFAEMPAWPQERDEAIRAGVNFLILTQPLDYVAGRARAS